MKKNFYLIGLGVFMVLATTSCKKDAECRCNIEREYFGADNQLIASENIRFTDSESDLNRKDFKEYKENCEKLDGFEEKYNDGVGRVEDTYSCKFNN